MGEPAITILSESDALPHPPASKLFKQSVMRWFLGFVVLDAMATGLALAIILAGAPAILWIGVAIFLALTPLVVKGLIRSLAPTNWIVRIDDDAMFVHYRSFHRDSGPGAITACRIPFAMISGARTVTERFARKKKDSSEKWTEHSLELQLEPGTGNDLFLAIHDDRAANAIDPTSGDKKKMVMHHYPVRMPDPETIRIKFSGRRDHVTPNDSAALDALSAHCQMLDSLEIDYTKVAQLSQPEFDEALLSLAESGQLFAAVYYLRARTDCSLSEARDTIDQLLGQKPLDLSSSSQAA